MCDNKWERKEINNQVSLSLCVSLVASLSIVVVVVNGDDDADNDDDDCGQRTSWMR